MTVRLFLLSLCAVVLSGQVFGPPQPTQFYSKSPVLRGIGIDPKIGTQIPLDVPFEDESGRVVTFRQFTVKPTVLALVYFQCPSHCNMVLNGVLKSAKASVAT